MAATNEQLLLSPQNDGPGALDSLASTRLSSLLSDAPAVARVLLDGDPAERADVHLVLRTVAAVMRRGLDEHNPALFKKGIEALAAIWLLGDPTAMYPIKTPDLEASLWEAITIEVFALGGLTVEHERWEEMRALVTEQPDPGSHDRSWVRQGQVASSRASFYPDESVISVAVNRLGAVSYLSDEASLKRVCEFDMLAALILSETDPDAYFPNSAEFSDALVEPLVIDALRDDSSSLRAFVFPGDDPGIRDALRDFDAKARTQAAHARYGGKAWKWRAFSDGRTWTFINAGHMLEEWTTGSGWTA